MDQAAKHEHCLAIGFPLMISSHFRSLQIFQGEKGTPAHSTSMHKQGEPEPKHLIVRAGESLALSGIIV